MRKGLLILFILLIVVGGGYYFYTRSKSVDPGAEQPSLFPDFFPVGTTGTGTFDGTLTDTPILATPPRSTSLFRQLTSQAVAGYSAYSLKSNPLVRYVARTSGYVYEIQGGEVANQVSNIYIPNIYEAVFMDKGSTAIVRFLRPDKRTIASYAIAIPELNPDGTRTQKPGVYLPDSVQSMAVSSDRSLLARLIYEKGGSVLTMSTSANESKKELLQNPFREWLVSWPSTSHMYLQTKASALADGYLYEVDQTNKRLSRVLGTVPGLTTSVSPRNTYVLYSESTNAGFNANIMTIKTGVVRSLGKSILPEKCAWLESEDLICAGSETLAQGQYPDDWYKGVVLFSDTLYRIYTASNSFDVLHTPTETEHFDMTHLQVNESNNTLYFVDKPTGLLWQFLL